MKSKNKIKIFAATAAIASIAAPVVTLASCAKNAPVYIEDADKAQKLTSGQRKATYTFKLRAPLEEKEKISITLDNIRSTQAGFTIKIEDVKYATGSSNVEAIFYIDSDGSNAILQDGTKFIFDAIVQKFNDQETELFSTKISNISIEYGAAATRSIIKLISDKETYTDPGSAEHTFTFDTSESNIDETCTFDIEAVKVTGSAEHTIKHMWTRFDSSLKRLYVRLAIDGGTLSTASSVLFNFSISCIKNKVELWRQSFDGLKISYLEHQMWIFDKYQAEYTNAGEKSFHLYVSKKSNIHWDDPDIKPSITIDNVKPITAQLSFDKTAVTERTTPEYSYFDVPINIALSATEDTEITYDVTLKGNFDGKTLDKKFEGRKIVYHIARLDETEHKEAIALVEKNTSLEFNFSDTTSLSQTKSVQCEINQLSSNRDMIVETTGSKLEGNKVNLPLYITTNFSSATATCDFIFKGLDDNSNVIWTQCMKEYTVSYYEGVTIEGQKFSTEKETNVAYIPYETIAPDSTITEIEVTNLTHASEIKDAHFDPDLEHSKIKVTLEPNEQSHLCGTSYARFDLTLKGQMTRWGKTISWSRTFTKCEVDYFGTIEFNEETSRWQSSYVPGFQFAFYSFKNYSNAFEIKATAHKVGGTYGYLPISLEVLRKSSVDIQVFLNFLSPQGQYVQQDGAWVTFTLTFEGYDGSGKLLWTKELGTEESPFGFQYISKFSVKNRSVLTDADMSTYTYPQASFKFKNQYYEENRYITFRVENQTGSSGVKAKARSKRYYPKKDEEFDVYIDLSKENPFVEGDSACFDLVCETYNSDSGELVFTETYKDLRVTYTAKHATWETNDWYVYDLAAGVTNKSADQEITFNLNRAIDLDTQHIEVSVTQTGGTDNVTIACANTKPTPSGTVLKVPMNLSTTEATFTNGDYAMYTISISCLNTATSAVVWTAEISDCYLAMLSSFSVSQTEVTTSGTSADFSVDLTTKMKTGSTMEIYPVCYGVTSSVPGLGVTPETPTYSASQPLKISQKINLSNPPAELKTGDYVEFKLRYIVKVTLGTFIQMLSIDVSQDLKITIQL